MMFIIIPIILIWGYFFPPHYEVSVEYKTRIVLVETGEYTMSIR